MGTRLPVSERIHRLSMPSFIEGTSRVCSENHDQARSISRFMNDSPEYRTISGKTLAMYLLTLSGTPILYQGRELCFRPLMPGPADPCLTVEEIGMVNMPKDWPESEYIDPMSWMFMQDIRDDIKHGVKGISEEHAFKSIQTIGRDHARVPMQWSHKTSAGFSTNEKTWMRVNTSYKDGINVEEEEQDPNSVLQFYRRLLAFRKEHSASLIFGDYNGIEPDNDSTMQFSKKAFDGETLFVALNFSGKEQPVSLPNGKGELLMTSSVHPDNEDKLQPYEGRIYKI